MSDLPRAFLTPGEREAIDPGNDMDPNTRGAHLSRIRRKVEKMRQDMDDLREHRPAIAEALEEAICHEDMEERLQRLEDEVAHLREELGEEREGDT